MQCKISTGRRVGPSPQASQSESGPPPSRVLFNEQSTDVQSRVFCIGPGEERLLSAYGITEEDCIVVHRLVLTPGVIRTIKSGCECIGDIASAPTVAYEKPLKDCNEIVTMHCAQDELSIPGPGCYRLVLGNEDMLGRIYVEIQDAC